MSATGVRPRGGCYHTAPRAVALLRFPASVPVSLSSPGARNREEHSLPKVGPEWCLQVCLNRTQRLKGKGCSHLSLCLQHPGHRLCILSFPT